MHLQHHVSPAGPSAALNNVLLGAMLGLWSLAVAALWDWGWQVALPPLAFLLFLSGYRAGRAYSQERGQDDNSQPNHIKREAE